MGVIFSFCCETIFAEDEGWCDDDDFETGLFFVEKLLDGVELEGFAGCVCYVCIGERCVDWIMVCIIISYVSISRCSGPFAEWYPLPR